MIENQKINANFIKSALLDFLLKENSFDLIANEVPFFKGNRWADILAIRNNLLIGYEIKSKLDTLKFIDKQLNDYKKIFNQVYLVYSNKFSGSCEIKQLNHNIGLIEIDDHLNISIKRFAKSKLLLQKKDIISLLWRRDLESLTKQKGTREHLEKIVLAKTPRQFIHAQVITSLIRRYGASYENFLRDCSNYTTIEDLKTITGIKPLHDF